MNARFCHPGVTKQAGHRESIEHPVDKVGDGGARARPGGAAQCVADIGINFGIDFDFRFNSGSGCGMGPALGSQPPCRTQQLDAQLCPAVFTLGQPSQRPPLQGGGQGRIG